MKKYQDLIDAAQEIIGDFDTWGEVLQMDDGGSYGPKSAIERLRKALRKLN